MILKLILLLAVNLKICQLQRRIFYGTDTKPNEFPYMVFVRGAVSCGGALLSEKYVLTAAKCLHLLSPNDEVRVILGRNKIFDYEEGSIIIDSKKFWIHENFSMPSAVNDIAIIELPLAVIFTSQIQSVKISNEENVDERAIIAGWGAVEPQYEFPGILKKARMKIMGFNECVKYQDHYVEKITENHICAIGVHKCRKKIVSPCNGDFGSPLVDANSMEIIGITSFVKDAENGVPLGYNDCTSKKTPAVFVKVSSYLDWISEKTDIEFR